MPHDLAAQIFHMALLFRVEMPRLERVGCATVLPVADHPRAYCRSSLLLARVIPPRHHRRVQAVVEHLVYDARAHLLHSLLLQRMRMPALKRGGCASVGPMA